MAELPTELDLRAPDKPRLQGSRRSMMRVPNWKIPYSVLITFILSTVVVCSASNLPMDLFRTAMRERFPDRNIDMNRLLRQYTGLCPYLTECDRYHMVEPVPIVYSRPDVSIPSCQPCDCSFRCMENGNCCPGSPFQYIQFEQVNLIVYSGHDRPPVMVYMIVQCPPWYNKDQHVIDRCMGDDSLLFPTISDDTMLTYKNKYCAACHNDIRDLRTLELNVYCLGANDAVSRHTDYILNKTGCWLSFYPNSYDFPKTLRPVKAYNNDVISTCNVTGLWTEFDQDVKWACENMVYFYQGFKNPFCYICNPSILSTQTDLTLIESCNVTGNWMIYRPEVANACRSESQTQRLFPFKNIHCMICNGIDGIRGERTFNVSIAETIYPPQMNITLQFNTIDSAVFLKDIQNIFNVSDIRLKSPEMVKNRIKIGNLSNVMSHYESICGLSTSCRSADDRIMYNYSVAINKNCWKHISTSRPLCTCSKDCVEHKICCPHMLLKFSPHNCVSAQSFPSWNGNVSNIADLSLPSDISVIDECLTEDKVGAYFSFNSTDGLAETILNIPVRIRYVVGSKHNRKYTRYSIYKNLMIMLCNTARQTAYVDMRLQCSIYLEYRLFTNIVQLLHTAKQYCNIQFLPLHASQCSKTKQYSNFFEKHYGRRRFTPRGNLSENMKKAIISAHTWTDRMETISKCNQTKMWREEQPDIKLICEGESTNIFELHEYKFNGFQYKNVACFICNPLLREDDIDHVISTCNVTGAWPRLYYDALLEEQCSMANYEDRFLPFKNWFCSECNLPELEKLSNNIGYGGGQFYGKKLFAISEMQWQQHAEPKEMPTECFNDTTYPVQDDECREVICSKYHHLENGQCNSYVRMVNYAFAFELSWRHVPCDSSRCNQRYCKTMKLNLLVEQILIYISNRAYRDEGAAEVIGFVDSSCDKNNNIFNMFASSTLISYTITSVVAWDVPVTQRTELEQNFVNFLYKEHALNISVDSEKTDYCSIVFQPVPRSSHVIEKDKVFINKREQCYYVKRGQNDLYLRDEVIVVDRYLLCPQLEFSPDEYRHNTADDTVTITSNGVTFTSDFFKKQGTAIRICLEDYKEHLNRTNIIVENPLLEAYNLFSDIVISISIVCLALTFATYCLLPSLRTLPGRNIMVLSFSLMCAQALLLSAQRLERGTILCKTMGILIHYFWLATYGAMNICSYHLFNVFYINALTKATADSDNRRLSVYLSYIFGTPLLVVVTTICIHAIPSNGQSVGYGDILCFLSDINASIASFITPSMLVFLSNIVFFGLAFHKIRTTGKVQASRNTERSDLFICIRICTITGITGPLYLLDSFIGFSYFSFVVEGINSLQGLLIFLSYVCNQRVLAMFREKFNMGQNAA